ncbi:MAG: hypothetical protein Q8927_08315 [Bacteroidota bacterium]|nr:hypothetical protein [Bacteroidota bacterium]MDP4244404.1 hypothetical protein [Bacteroidota bacterium]MDP4256421.1 hypothetical protein [Bacteroidota bacterium]MDP4259783.1 hypothetical protein [Bacteroidota bacterium]
MLTIIIGCSKKNAARTNFAELTVDGKKVVFDSLEAVFDTSAQAIDCNFQVYKRGTGTHMEWETESGSRWINGIYNYPGESLPGRSIVYLHIQNYINNVPGSYTLVNNSLTMTIDQSTNGRLHGTFSGKITCYTCNPYGAEVDISNGEFEMPYSYR